MHFIFVYVIYKSLFLKHYRKTGVFDEMLPINTIWYLKFGVFMHLCMGAFVFSNSNILSEGAFTMINDYKDQALAAGGVSDLGGKPKKVPTAAELKTMDEDSFLVVEDKSWTDRFTSGIGILYLVFFILVIVAYIFKKTFIALVIWIVAKILYIVFYILTCKCLRGKVDRRASAKKMEGKDNYSNDLIADLKLGSLLKFYDRVKLECSQAEVSDFKEFELFTPSQGRDVN